MIAYVSAFAAAFIYTALKSWQQLNVVKQNYWWILPTSLAMAACEVWVVSNVAMYGFGWLVLAIGLGAGLGSMSATYIHWRHMR